MAKKRVLTEQDKVKRRQTSREFRKKKKETDPLWHEKEAARIAKLYVPKSEYSKEKWEEYKKAKREGMARYRAKKKEASLEASVPTRRGRSTIRTPPEEFQELPARTRKKELSTTPTTDDDNLIETPSTSYRLIVKLPAVVNKCRALKRKLEKTEAANASLKRNMGKLKKKIYAQGKPPSTPVLEAKKILEDIGKTPTQSAVKKMVPYTATVNAVRKSNLPTKRKLLDSASPKSRKKRGIQAAAVAKATKTPRRYVFTKSLFKSRSTRKVISNARRNLVIAFLKRPDNSYQLPGIKDQARGQTKYGLTDTMQNLYLKFRSEHVEIQMSKAVFFAARPKHIKLVQWTNRRQCLCQKCANMALKIAVTKALPKSARAVSDMIDSEVMSKLEDIPSRITFKQWCRVDVDFNGKKIKKMKRINTTQSKPQFIKTFIEKLHEFKDHCLRVETQYSMLRVLKQKLKPMEEATVQCDYAENWKCGYQDEISAVFYDQNLITIHPMVVHYRDDEGCLQHTSFVGVTEEGKHCAPTTLSFIQKFIPELRLLLPNLAVLHYITDSPSSQYRNKTIAAIVARHPLLFDITSTWTYLESGHGKGPCDGVGGAIKKMADNSVKRGDTITNVDEFMNVLQNQPRKMKMIRVTSKEVEKMRKKVASWDIIPCNGIGSSHALLPVGDVLMMKETSCFQDCCYEAGVFHPSCDGWQTTNVKTFKGKHSTAVQEDSPDDEEIVTPQIHPEAGLQNDNTANTSVDLNSDSVTAEDVQPDLQLDTNMPDATNLKIDDHVVAVHGKRWYIAKITGLDQDGDYILSFMTPVRSKWKWGQSDVGTINRNNVLLKVEEPQKDDKNVLLNIRSSELEMAEKLYKKFKADQVKSV